MNKESVYYCDTASERVKIVKVFTSGLAVVRNKVNFEYQVLINELTKI